MNYRAHGFTQRKPTVPGVYLISFESHKGINAPPRHREGWEVAELYWFAGSYFNHHEITPERGVWRVRALDGLEYTWKKGMWIKGPLAADSSLTPNCSGSTRADSSSDSSPEICNEKVKP